jgi:hypothetical protein
MKTLLVAAGFTILSAIASVGAWAVPGQSTTPTGAAFTSACAGNGYSGSTSVGNAINNGVSTSSGSGAFISSLTCVTNTSGVGGQATTGTLSSASAYNGHAYSNSASAIAQPGVIKLQSTNTGSSASAFPGAGAQGGWNETFTPVGGGANGTPGILVVPMHVSGHMESNGVGANGLFEIGAYRNNAFMQPYGNAINQASYNVFQALNSAFNPHINQMSVAVGTVLFGWDYQMKPYGAVDYGPGALTTTSLVIDEVVHFAIPITWGQSFLLGIYAMTSSGETASGGAVVLNTASAEFQNTVFWTGDYYALAADGSGGPITGFSLTSGSGIDYSMSFEAPEPASLSILAGGLAAMGLLRRRAPR